MPRTKHGYAMPSNPLARTHRVWRGIHNRCYNCESKAYPRYGGRGITVSHAWRNFEQFVADMGPAPAGMTLDRRDNNKGYSKANCRWATYTTQNRNRGVYNRKFTLAGETLCASAWADRAGISRQLFHYRIANGWSLAETLAPAHSAKR